MYQDLIVYGIIGLTVGMTVLSTIKNFRPKKNTGACCGCSGCEPKCNNINNEIIGNKNGEFQKER